MILNSIRETYMETRLYTNPIIREFNYFLFNIYLNMMAQTQNLTFLLSAIRQQNRWKITGKNCFPKTGFCH